MQLRFTKYLLLLLLVFTACDSQSDTSELPNEPDPEAEEDLTGIWLRERSGFGPIVGEVEIDSESVIRHIQSDPIPVISANIGVERHERILTLFEGLEQMPVEAQHTGCAEAPTFTVQLLETNVIVLQRSFFTCGASESTDLHERVASGVDSILAAVDWLHENHDPWRGLETVVSLAHTEYSYQDSLTFDVSIINPSVETRTMHFFREGSVETYVFNDRDQLLNTWGRALCTADGEVCTPRTIEIAAGETETIQEKVPISIFLTSQPSEAEVIQVRYSANAPCCTTGPSTLREIRAVTILP